MHYDEVCDSNGVVRDFAMNWLRSCFCRAALVCIALTACVGLSATKPEAPVYDVRSAVVLSGPNMATGAICIRKKGWFRSFLK